MLATAQTGQDTGNAPSTQPSLLQALVFRRSGASLAVPLSNVRAMTVADSIRDAHRTCSEIRGFCDFEEWTVPVVDFARPASIPLKSHSKRILVICHNTRLAGILYDQVLEVCALRGQGLLTSSHDAHLAVRFVRNGSPVMLVKPAPLLDAIEKSAQATDVADARQDLAG